MIDSNDSSTPKWSLMQGGAQAVRLPGVEQKMVQVDVDADPGIVALDAEIVSISADASEAVEQARAICADGNLSALSDEDKAKYEAEKAKAEGLMLGVENAIERRKLLAMELRAKPKLQTMPMPMANASAIGLQTRARIESVHSSRTMKAFPNTVEGRSLAYTVGRFVDAVIFKRPTSIQWCNERGITYMGQQTGNVNQAGGIWVPIEWSDRIIENRDSFGKFRMNAFIESMASETRNIRRRKGAYQAQHVGAGQATQLADPNIWDLVYLVAKKISIYTTLTDEQSEDTLIGMADSMTSAAGEGLAMREDLDGFLGDGSSEYGGIVGLFVKILQDDRVGAVKAAVGHSTMEDIDADDLTRLMGTLPVYAQQSPNKKWYMSGYAYQTVAGRISLGGGGNTITDIAQGWTPMFAGSPVELVEVLPGQGDLTGQGMIGYGDLMRSSTMGDRAGITFKQSEHALFDTDEIALKWQERYDISNHDLGDDVKAGSFVVLVGA